jgi:hypothetical protein
MTGSSVKNLQLLQDLCGNELKNVLLVTTFWDLVPKGQGEKREAELANNYWRPLLELGSRMHRYRHKSSGEDLIRDILDHQSHIIELQLQIELTQAERTLLDTMAGRRLEEGLNHQLEQLGMTLNQVQEEQRAVEGRRNTGRDEKARVNAHERRILEEIATIEKDLEMLGMPRYIAMQEIDEKVADIIVDTGRDETEAFWDLYGAFDDDDRSGLGSPRESLGMDRGQPTSPGHKPTGYGDEHFGRKQTETYNLQQKPRDSPGANETSHVGRRDQQRGYGSQQQVSSEEGPIEQGGQQLGSRYDLQAFEELSIGNDPHLGHYGGREKNSGSNFTGYGQPQQRRRNDFDEYGNPRQNTGGYGDQYRRDSQGY